MVYTRVCMCVHTPLFGVSQLLSNVVALVSMLLCLQEGGRKRTTFASTTPVHAGLHTAQGELMVCDPRNVCM